MHYFCCEERRRAAIRAHPTLNGIDFLDVRSSPKPLKDQGQDVLVVHFVKPLQRKITRRNVLIEGGERIPNVTAIAVRPGRDDKANALTIYLDKTGDFSVYTLRLVRDSNAQPPRPLSGIDVPMSAVDFFFNAGQADDSDCQEESTCLPALNLTPEIDYLAKDYNSFRRMMLDRMTQLMPEWKERSPADIGIVLVELLAYVGDYLSYQQDVLATESYLDTARRRISVRRHARLIDYFMHDGCNARVWVQLQVRDDIVKKRPDDPQPLPKGTQLLTRLPGQEVCISFARLDNIMAMQPDVFETVYDTEELYQQHNEMYFYTWGARACCLPKGATRATLQGRLSNLKPGQVLIFKEVLGPRTGSPNDADTTHRCAVRLTKVTYTTDPLGGWFTKASDGIPAQEAPEDYTPHSTLTEPNEPADKDLDRGIDDQDTVKLPPLAKSRQTKGGQSVDVDLVLVEPDEPTEPLIADEEEPEDIDYTLDVTEIEWHSEDALPFALTISSKTDFTHGRQYIEDVSIALGNIVLADHGYSVIEELAAVPCATLSRIPGQSTDRCQPLEPVAVPSRYQPRLNNSPLTQVAPYKPDNASTSARAVMRWDVHDPQLLPAITLDGTTPLDSIERDDAVLTWYPQRDLLNSTATQLAFVAEVDTDGSTYLRFGDGLHGLRPVAGTTFTANYRVGNGEAGNAGAEVIAHTVSDQSNIVGVCNPLPAQGGIEPEGIEAVRQQAPSALRMQQRAVTPNDYVEMAKQHPDVRQATTTIRWIGGVPTVFLTVERSGRAPVDQDFKDCIDRYMQRFRLAGYDLVINGPVYVSLEVEMVVLVNPNYFRGDVKSVLLNVLSNRELPNGQRGLFHPNNFTFGQAVYISPLYAAALAVEGVDAVEITKFQRQHRPGSEALEEGMLSLERVEIARLDNNPNFPDRGILRVKLERGK